MTRVICVSGNLGSGKSSLAERLAALLHWKKIPVESYARSYLTDLFRMPNRWAFEAQLSFLRLKANSLIEAQEQGLDVVVDRSIYEDIDVFARHFYLAGYMDKRAIETYNSYAQRILQVVPKPFAVIYCECPPRVCQTRIDKRPILDKGFQRYYPPRHLELLHRLYQEWMASFSVCSLFKVDTVMHDTREDHVVRKIIQELTDTLAADSLQLQLFSKGKENDGEQSDSSPILQRVSKTERMARALSRGDFAPLTFSSPSVYIAAPFTAAAKNTIITNEEVVLQKTLVDIPSHHGVIAEGQYRRALQSIAKSFRAVGYEVLLPHRDVNKWGLKQLSPQMVAEQCLKYVQACDLFFGLLGMSYGAHVEAGIALVHGHMDH